METSQWSIAASRSLVDTKKGSWSTACESIQSGLKQTFKKCCYSLSVWFEQDLVFELLAFTQLQVEDEAWDALQLLTEILHFQLSYLGMYKHHELPCTAKKTSFYYQDHQQQQCNSNIFFTLITSWWIFKATMCRIGCSIVHIILNTVYIYIWRTIRLSWWKLVQSVCCFQTINLSVGVTLPLGGG